MDFLRNYSSLIILAVVILVGIFVACYVKAPPDMALIISGLWKKPQILIGQAGFRIPFLEQVDKLYLKPVTIRITPYLPGTFFKLELTVKISTVEEMLFLAAKHFLNDSSVEIEKKLEKKLEAFLTKIIAETNNFNNIDENTNKYVEAIITPYIESLGLYIVAFNFNEI